MIFGTILTEKIAFVLLAFMESNHVNSKIRSMGSGFSNVAI